MIFTALLRALPAWALPVAIKTSCQSDVMFKCLVPVNHSTANSDGAALRYARAAEGGAGEEEGRGNGGTGEGSRSGCWW
jgi:hypothetical protein